LRSMEGLPVWLVIRLCTDDDDVVDVSQIVFCALHQPFLIYSILTHINIDTCPPHSFTTILMHS